MLGCFRVQGKWLSQGPISSRLLVSSHTEHRDCPFSTKTTITTLCDISPKEKRAIRRIADRYSTLRLQDICSILKSKGHNISYDQLVDIFSTPSNESGDIQCNEIEVADTSRRSMYNASARTTTVLDKGMSQKIQNNVSRR